MSCLSSYSVCIIEILVKLSRDVALPTQTQGLSEIVVAVCNAINTELSNVRSLVLAIEACRTIHKQSTAGIDAGVMSPRTTVP